MITNMRAVVNPYRKQLFDIKNAILVMDRARRRLHWDAGFVKTGVISTARNAATLYRSFAMGKT
jgi:hypothetical protein